MVRGVREGDICKYAYNGRELLVILAYGCKHGHSANCCETCVADTLFSGKHFCGSTILCFDFSIRSTEGAGLFFDLFPVCFVEEMEKGVGCGPFCGKLQLLTVHGFNSTHFNSR